MEKLLDLRRAAKKRKPDFIRKDYHKKKRLGTKWVRPRGLQSKLRLRKKGHRKVVTTGYGSPKEVRGLDRSGLERVIVENKNQIERIDPKKQGIVISSKVGLKKRLEIIKTASEKKVIILNIKDTAKYQKDAEDRMKEKKEKKEKRKKKKEDKEKKKKQEKKEEKSIEKTLTEEEKQEEEKKKKEEEKKEKDKLLIKRT